MCSDRDKIVALAREWLGTPYLHQACVKGVAADCIGFVRGVRAEYLGYDVEYRPTYSPAWGEVDRDELLLKAAHEYFVPVDYSGWKPGDLLVFRVKFAKSAKHCAIAIDGKTMLHAVGNRAVIETGIGAWSSRVAGVFKFPGVDEWQQ